MVNFALQGGGKRLPNYHLVGGNCILVDENLFDPPDLVGENTCLLKIDDTPKKVKKYKAVQKTLFKLSKK